MTCDNISISLEELLNSLLVKDDDGNYGLRTTVITKACADVSPASPCEGPLLSVEQIMRMIIAPSTDCGKPAIVLIQDND